MHMNMHKLDDYVQCEGSMSWFNQKICVKGKSPSSMFRFYPPLGMAQVQCLGTVSRFNVPDLIYLIYFW